MKKDSIEVSGIWGTMLIRPEFSDLDMYELERLKELADEVFEQISQKQEESLNKGEQNYEIVRMSGL